MLDGIPNIGTKTATTNPTPATTQEETRTIADNLRIPDPGQIAISVIPLMSEAMSVFQLVMTARIHPGTLLTVRITLLHPPMVAALFLGMQVTPTRHITEVVTTDHQQIGIPRGVKASGFQTLDSMSVTENFARVHQLHTDHPDMSVLGRTRLL